MRNISNFGEKPNTKCHVEHDFKDISFSADYRDMSGTIDVSTDQKDNFSSGNTSSRRGRKGDYYRTLALRTLGNFLVISSIFMIGKTFYQPVTEEMRYFANKYFEKEYIVPESGYGAGSDTNIPKEERSALRDGEVRSGGLAGMLNIKKVEVLVPEDSTFSVVIPKIGANARVVPDVDASKEEIYLDSLRHGVAHVKGTDYPGESGHIFLFAHSTDYVWNVGAYNAVFYLLYKLEVDDEVNIFYQGRRFRYKVTDSRVVDPTEVEYVNRKTDKEFVTLQTCWPPGTTLKRLLVFAERVEE